jgi:tetratricopeptide (TPR) repeat protein
VKALRVISRTSVMRYKGSNKTLQDIAAELGVQAVVEGSVTRAGDRVRVTAQLVRANPETNLWADDYEGEMRDVLTVQKNVADAVVRQVQVKVTAEDRSRQAGPKQVDPKAYESYLRGRYMLSRVSTAGRLQAMQQFRDAIAADSNYSSPYAGIAELEVFSLPSAEHMPKAREAAERALQIDPDNADAHMALGLVHLYGDWDWDGAQREFERALQLNPSSPNILGRYMIFLWSVGRFDEAIRSGEQARQIDPFSVAVNLDLARAYYFARRHDDAIKQFRKTLELDPSNGLTHQFLGIAYETKGMYPEAVGEIATAAQLNARPQWALKMRQSFASKGFHGFLEQWAAEYEESVKAGRSQSWSLGIVYAQLGNKDKAFEWLNKAVREKDRAVVLTKAEPQSDFLRNDPRFGEITKRVGFR